ncbi:DUF6153 family protein [Micromonospora sp. CA-263727]|uniref:DUF6153 family protein n=1 Tax=Micromonospora sp. CA-263727 TaxID=3239967 RepID=UPI003D945ED1
MRGEAATTGRWLRFVLLACTLFGLTVMHSLGHDPILGTAGHGSHAAPVTPALAGDCHGDHCTRLVAPASEGPGPGHPPGWAVCMAILASFSVGLLVAVVLLRGTRAGRRRGRTSTRASGGRAPPFLTPIGLSTASISVLRM